MTAFWRYCQLMHQCWISKNKSVAIAGFPMPISNVEIQVKIGDTVPKATKYKEKWGSDRELV